MLRGFATVNLFADDVDAARQWYSELLGVDAYFARQFQGKDAYIEFRVGDYQHELGILDRRFSPHPQTGKPAGTIMYWHVDDIAATHARLLELGAEPHDPITPRGDSGFVTASVLDPFGNVLGIMSNPHYLEILARHAV